jgi:saccharopine dehydrogenase (NAD+, L-lysine-forming)
MGASQTVVIGGGGLQAQALLQAAAKGADLTSWVAVDRAWLPERRESVEGLGAGIDTCDLLAEPERLREIVAGARLVINCAGPFYRTGTAVLDACIDGQTDYLDICDDADATLTLLERDEAARSAGVHALIGMGSSPGVTNVLVRAAVDALGRADEVDIAWVVDIEDVSNAAIQHFWHIFALVDDEGRRRPVAAWEDLSTRTVDFPTPLGVRTLLELSHPEPLTIPRFLPVGRVRNFGGIAPDDALFVSWALARMGADGAERVVVDGTEHQVPDVAVELYAGYRSRRTTSDYLGGGLHIDVHTGGNGFRFASGDSMSMEESTGTPAAAGALMMLAGEVPEPGVFAPECLDPAAFFRTLGSVSRSSGSLSLHRLVDGAPTERLRIRDLFTPGVQA